MERVELAEGLTLSRIVYGMWRLAEDPDRSPARVRAKIEACLAAGITSIDQADVYGDHESQALLGAALAEDAGLRARLEIVTKCGVMAMTPRFPLRRVKHYDTSAGHIAVSVDGSLAAMGIEQIDLLLVHRPDPLMDHMETGRALDDLVAGGKVRAVGVSNFRPHDFALLQSAMETPLVTNQIELGLMAPAGFLNGELAFLQERGLPPMAWSPLGGGRLFSTAPVGLWAALRRVGAEQGVDAAAVALAWLLRHPAGILPVIGTGRPERIAGLADAMTVQIDRETWFELLALATGSEVA
ncbi:MAG: aldo/keto reductase [Rhodobacteraceae bacterium]|jgi:predicted oxidoreductase|nr:aldo/keto reductase [Paracoccaceae bacterium]